jgi:hypothetical protein
MVSIHQLGCSSQQNNDPVGVVRVAVTMVPADVLCISLTAAAARTVTQQFDVMPGASAVLTMPGVPTGSVTFSGAAFGGACSTVTDPTTANWVSDPVTVQVTPGVIVDVSLVMHRNGRARVGVDFQDDTTATCSDGIQNSTETDVDCGGTNMAHICSPCADGKRCLVGRDCLSGVCTGGICGTPTCTDGVTNGRESGVDCGGQTMCPRCADGQTCTASSDCASGSCDFTMMRCATVAPTCSDGIQNSTETDVDCGGTNMAHICSPCADGKHCQVNRDCVSGVCTGGVCAVATCSDGVRNGGESGVDCGGPTACPRCPIGQGCVSAMDCVNANCDFGSMTCAATTASCSDGILNGSETDVDCGGACPSCPNGAHCQLDADCAGGSCSAGICATATTFSCTDGVKDGDETDIDCGGSCPGCAFGGRCFVSTDCFSGVCDPMRRRCLGSCTDGVLDGRETDVDCGFNACGVTCADGKQCVINNDCASNLCTGGICQTTSCTDGIRSGTETDVDCGGNVCRACQAGQRCRAPTDCFNGQCPFQGTCTAANTGCSIDGLFDGDETDLDCGGSCPACAIGLRCLVNDDCVKPQACVGGFCAATVSCTDGVQDGDETGVDCGGTACGSCPGASCRDAKECASRACLLPGSVCAGLACVDGVQDGTETDVDCGGGGCNPCITGLHCQVNSDCSKGGTCSNGTCAAPSCSDGVLNGAETGVDCGGLCAPCASGVGCFSDSDCVSGVCLSSVCF